MVDARQPGVGRAFRRKRPEVDLPVQRQFRFPVDELEDAAADAVDITFTLEEQNRNQLQFGAGLSEYDGAFFNLAYTTANLMGKGETLTLTGQRGTRSSVYQVAFSEPYAFGRPITAGVDLYSRKVDLLTGPNTIGYSEARSGINLTTGRALWRYSRALATYGGRATLEVVELALERLDDGAQAGDRRRRVLVDLLDGLLAVRDQRLLERGRRVRPHLRNVALAVLLPFGEDATLVRKLDGRRLPLAEAEVHDGQASCFFSTELSSSIRNFTLSRTVSSVEERSVMRFMTAW